MKQVLLFIFLVLQGLAAAAQTRLHQKAILVDTHNDVPSTVIEKQLAFDTDLSGKTHSDLTRLRQGGVDIQVFSIFCDGSQKDPYAWANREIDSVYAWVSRNPDKMMLVKNTSELSAAVKQNKLGAMLGVEGGHMMENDLANLEALYNRGVRYLTITWNNSTSWASSAADETASLQLIKKEDGLDSVRKKGLTDFGKTVIKKMNALGMLVDLSHVGEQTFWDVMNATTKPVLVSHSCVYALCPHRRNLKDEQIKAVGKNGGVIHLNFYSGFIDSLFEKRSAAFLQSHKAELDSLLKINPEYYTAEFALFEKYNADVQAMRPPLSLLLDHLDYIVKLIGVDHVGLGSDFDGVNSLPRELNDVRDFPLITKELKKRGYSKKDIYKMLGGNFIRLLKANEP